MCVSRKSQKQYLAISPNIVNILQKRISKRFSLTIKIMATKREIIFVRIVKKIEITSLYLHTRGFFSFFLLLILKTWLFMGKTIFLRNKSFKSQVDLLASIYSKEGKVLTCLLMLEISNLFFSFQENVHLNCFIETIIYTLSGRYVDPFICVLLTSEIVVWCKYEKSQVCKNRLQIVNCNPLTLLINFLEPKLVLKDKI